MEGKECAGAGGRGGGKIGASGGGARLGEASALFKRRRLLGGGGTAAWRRGRQKGRGEPRITRRWGPGPGPGGLQRLGARVDFFLFFFDCPLRLVSGSGCAPLASTQLNSLNSNGMR